jgi:hypothetical protein
VLFDSYSSALAAIDGLQALGYIATVANCGHIPRHAIIMSLLPRWLSTSMQAG